MRISELYSKFEAVAAQNNEASPINRKYSTNERDNNTYYNFNYSKTADKTKAPYYTSRYQMQLAYKN